MSAVGSAPVDDGARTKAAVSSIVALLSTANFVVFVIESVVVRLVAVPVPLWYYAIVGGVTIVVLVATWSPTLRVLPARLSLLGFSLRSGPLEALPLFATVSVVFVLSEHDPVHTLYRLDGWPAWLCLAAGALAFVRQELDPRPVTPLSPLLTRVPDPTRTARVLSAVMVGSFAASIALSIVGGFLDLPLPAAVLWIQPSILLVILIASLFKRNRWLPAGRFSSIRSVTPIRISLLALASLFVQIPLAVLISENGRGLGPSFYGVLELLGVFVVGLVAGFLVSVDGPTKRGPRRPRGAAPLVYVGKLPQVEIAPVEGWLALPSRFPVDGYPNATAWANGILPRLGAQLGTGTDELRHAYARSLVTLTNSRLKRGIGELFLKLEEWEGPFLFAGLSDEFSQSWQGMPVRDLDEEIAAEGGVEGVPLMTFTTTSGLEGHKRQLPGRVDYWVTVDGGWAHLSCEDEPDRIAAALPQLDALASAIIIGNRVVGRRKKPVS
jgi:hypothetical protein